MKIKVLIVDMEADNMTSTSNMINALAEVLRSAFPASEETQQEDIQQAMTTAPSAGAPQ